MGKEVILFENALRGLAFIVLAVAAGLLAHKILYRGMAKLADRSSSSLGSSLLRHSKKPAALLIPLFFAAMVLPFVYLPAAIYFTVEHLIGLAIIAGIAWLSIGAASVFSDVITSKYDVNVRDNLRARRVHTQVQVLRRIVVVIIIAVSISIMLMTFPEIRSIGAGLFASAGIAGLVIGMAARPALSNLIAGMQMALTEPIRLDDVVIVEGEWGRVEEITTTFVVIRVWDLRRLVVPLSYFIEKPFQNWTRQSADLIGTVFIYTDYHVPVEKVREKLRSILQNSKLWDGKTCSLQVTDTSERTVQLRALMSATDSSSAWDLRCEVREELIAFLQENYPNSLPKERVEIRRDQAL